MHQPLHQPPYHNLLLVLHLQSTSFRPFLVWLQSPSYLLPLILGHINRQKNFYRGLLLTDFCVETYPTTVYPNGKLSLVIFCDNYLISSQIATIL